MKILGDFGGLLELDADIKRQNSLSPAFSAFNRSKIAAFYKENTFTIDRLKKFIKDIQDKHVQVDDKFMYKQRIHPEGMPNTWDFKSEEDEKIYKAAWVEFMTKKIEIFI